MRRRLSLVLVLFVAACGAAEPTVEQRIDALLEGGKHFEHNVLPSRARMAELYPESPPDRSEWRIEFRLRENPDAAALLRAGERAVADLVRLVDDPKRRTLACLFLAEIGGVPAANSLLAAWRKERGRYVHKTGRYPTEGGMNYIAYTYEPADGGFSGELIAALCYTGRDVSVEIARDATISMDEAERLAAAGEKLDRQEKRTRPEGEVELFWDVEPVETACEGLHILGMAGANDAPALFARALRSSIRSLRWAAVQDVLYIGQGKETTLPALAPLLDGSDLRDAALRAVIRILDHDSERSSTTPAERTELVARYRKRLQELGYAPK